MAKPVYRHVTLKRFDAEYDHHARIGAPLEFCLHGDELDDWQHNGVKEAVFRLKEGYNPPVCLHGPIYAFDPASRDRAFLAMTERRSDTLLEIAALLDPETIVLHSSYIDCVRRYSQQSWLDDTVAFYRRLAEALPGTRCRIAIENIYESDPEPLATAIREIDHPRVGHCFDVGHFHMFQKHYGHARWLEAFPGKLYHLHIHDNLGQEDLHLPPGRGSIEYRPLIEILREQKNAWSVTVECRSAAENDEACEYVRHNFPGVWR